ncbi:MAG: GTPase Era [Candidatus Hinthialibacteria bacterium]
MSLLTSPEGFRSGFVSLLGRPNVGKSTLLNQLVGTKLAIVSNKPQTTRNRIAGIRTEKDCQFIFLDTPGIHKAREQMNRFMVGQAFGALADADIAVVLLDAEQAFGGGDAFVVERVREAGIPFIGVLNKIDRLRPDALSRAWEKFLAVVEGSVEQIAISALHTSGIHSLLDALRSHLPEGPVYYPEDTVTDRGMKFQISELIREQIYAATHEELPYATAVLIESIEDKGKDHPIVISALIVVESDSQKGIMIGRKGEMMKKIGINSRREIEKMLGQKVFLDLRAGVVKDWRKHPDALRRFGYAGEEMEPSEDPLAD